MRQGEHIVVKYTMEEKTQLVSEYSASGEEPRVWCEQKGLAYSTFTNWLRLSGIKEPIHSTKESAPARLSKLPAHEPNHEERNKESRIVWAALETQTERAVSNTTGSETFQPQIKLSRKGWAIDLAGGFDAELLEEVMKVVNRVCC